MQQEIANKNSGPHEHPGIIWQNLNHAIFFRLCFHYNKNYYLNSIEGLLKLQITVDLAVLISDSKSLEV